MDDLALIFPPQWSAFQPPLSLPALAAWMRRAGYLVSAFDANVNLYEWLLSERCVSLLSDHLRETAMSIEDQTTFKMLLNARSDFGASLSQLKGGPSWNGDDEDLIVTQKRAIRSLETWLSIVSRVAGEFSITPYSFELRNPTYGAVELEKAVAESSALLRCFIEDFLDQIDLDRFACIGLSCIGQEQLYFTLLFCSVLRERTTSPIIIGGTILTRIYERGKLPAAWFQKYFDIVVKNEGERPCEAILQNLRAGKVATEGVPGIVYSDGETIWSTPSPAPLKPQDVPTPDFDGMPLADYLSPSLTLPILSARGCYWGKCEFCHHGMVYGEKYASYDVQQLLASVHELSSRYGARHFSFNDEALPPKVARQIGMQFPASTDTGWTFTALYKFEKFYTADDFRNLHKIGLRSLYVGMESASERVLALMRKPNSREVVTRNLRDARDAGIWTHCFLFFGFPGETSDDAAETFEFVFGNQDLIASVGCGTFSLEHNAPISKHLETFGITLQQDTRADLSVYYEYKVANGIQQSDALSLTNQFNAQLYAIPKYLSVAWIPRDQLLIFLARMTPEKLVALSSRHLSAESSVEQWDVNQIFTPVGSASGGDDVILVLDRVTGRVLRMRNTAASLFLSLYEKRERFSVIRRDFPRMYRALFPKTDDRAASLDTERAAA